mgnify:CR=1 FL=1
MGIDSTGLMMGESSNPLVQFYLSLPLWGQALVRTFGVILAAAVLGMLVGKFYASVRYPDPEKTGALSPKVRAVFLVVLLLCGIWLYRSITHPPETKDLAVDGPEASQPTDEYAPDDAGAYAAVGGAVMLVG